MYLIGFPLLLIPFALYNIVAFLLNMSLDDKALTIPLLDERSMTVSVGEAIVVIAMLLLYIEILKATRLGKTGIDHVLSFVLLAAMASQLVLVPRAMTPTLMLLTVLGFVDFIAGFSVPHPMKRSEPVREYRDHEQYRDHEPD